MLFIIQYALNKGALQSALAELAASSAGAHAPPPPGVPVAASGEYL